jgi:Asp-tRNA(Asn)/Glu-tRNA(Gln) amidotransferase B subunit
MGDKILDLQKILNEYEEIDDFGFSAVSEEEYNKVVYEVVTEAEQNLESYKQRLTEVEKLIVPFLMKLLKTANKEYIYWPNREPVIKAQLEKIVKLTRG